jgi:hypothetical protein
MLNFLYLSIMPKDRKGICGNHSRGLGNFYKKDLRYTHILTQREFPVLKEGLKLTYTLEEILSRLDQKIEKQFT